MKIKYVAFILAVLSFVVVAGCTSSSGTSDNTSTVTPSPKASAESIIGTWAGETTLIQTNATTGVSMPYTVKILFDATADKTYAWKIDLSFNTVFFGDYKTTVQSTGKWQRFNETSTDIFYKVDDDNPSNTSTYTQYYMAYNKRLHTLRLPTEDGEIIMSKE